MRRFVSLLSLLSAASIFLGYTGPGDRTNITQAMIVRTQCLSTVYPGFPPVWRYRDWDGVYALPGSSEALMWQSLYPYAPEHTVCHSGLNGQYGWGEKTVALGSYAPVSFSQSIACSSPGNAGWCRGGLTQTLYADEPIPGQVVRYFESAVGTICDPPDGANVSCSRAILQQGAGSESAWAVSSWGDTSFMETYSWKLDSVQPTNLTTLPTPDPNGWHKSSVSVTISGTDAASGIDPVGYRYRVNGGAWQPGNILTISADGVYAVETEVRDVAGNVTAQAVTVKKDATPPALSLPYAPDGANGWYQTLAVIAPVASDSISGLDFVSPPVTLSEGVQTITATATDKAGNAASVSQVYRVDVSPPFLSLNLSAPPADSGWFRAAVTGEIVTTDAVSGMAGVRYRVNGGDWQTGIIHLTEDGVYEVAGEGTDLAGNAASQTYVIRLDQTPPSLSLDAPIPDGANGWYKTYPVIRLSASDGMSGIHYASFDDGRDALTLTDGIRVVTATALDMAGNASSVSNTFRVDSLPPAISFLQEGETVSGLVRLSGAVSDGISGVAAVWLSFDGSSWLTAELDSANWTWYLNWDASALESGEYPVWVQAEDVAGNIQTKQYIVNVDNRAPSVSAQGWTAPGQGGYLVAPPSFPISSVRAVIRDRQGGEIELYQGTDVSGVLTWNWPIPGVYPLEVSACDIYNRCSSAHAEVVILPTPLGSEEAPTPSPLLSPASVRPTSLPAPLPTAIMPQVVTQKRSQISLNLAPLLFVVILLIAAALLLSDPRPRALRQLSITFRGLPDDNYNRRN